MTKRAIEEAENLLERFKETGSYSLFKEDGMELSSLKRQETFGVLIALTKTGEERVIYAFSGSIGGKYLIKGYVPPCFSTHDFNEAVGINDKRIHQLTERIDSGEVSLKEERARLSNETLRRIRGLYRFRSWNGEDIAGVEDGNITGVGECAGVKLINYALRRGWEIKGLCEFQIDGKLSSPCKERCSHILPKMLGLNYIYADEDIAAVNKETGFLSTPGKGEEKMDSVSYRFHTLFPSSPKECHIHRLDMDTSGVMLLAFNREALIEMQREFAEKRVKKTYIGLVDGIIDRECGEISIPIRLDISNRPYQIEDRVNGKSAITLWKKLGYETYRGRRVTRIEFQPLTGRTHQIRVHASLGLGAPIVGDRLYGKSEDGERLYLHAESIEFEHPRTKERMRIESETPF